METIQTVCSTDQMTSKEILTAALADAGQAIDHARAFYILQVAVETALSQIDEEMDDVREGGYQDGREDGWYDGRADCAEESDL